MDWGKRFLFVRLFSLLLANYWKWVFQGLIAVW